MKDVDAPEAAVGKLLATLLAACDITDEQWRRETDGIGIISGHKHRCMLIATILETLALTLREGRHLTGDDLREAAADIRAHQHDTINAFAERVTAAQQPP